MVENDSLEPTHHDFYIEMLEYCEDEYEFMKPLIFSNVDCKLQ